jgi:hypothetical protein
MTLEVGSWIVAPLVDGQTNTDALTRIDQCVRILKPEVFDFLSPDETDAALKINH